MYRIWYRLHKIFGQFDGAWRLWCWCYCEWRYLHTVWAKLKYCQKAQAEENRSVEDQVIPVQGQESKPQPNVYELKTAFNHKVSKEHKNINLHIWFHRKAGDIQLKLISTNEYRVPKPWLYPQQNPSAIRVLTSCGQISEPSWERIKIISPQPELISRFAWREEQENFDGVSGEGKMAVNNW